MCKLGTFGDEICMQIFANLVGRDILYIPMFQTSAHIMKQYCLIRSDSRQNDSDPITLLWFEETMFEAGHFQSVVPGGDSLIMKHYFKQNNLRVSITTPGLDSCIAEMRLQPISTDIPNSQSSKKSCLESVNRSHANKTCHLCNSILRIKQGRKKCICGKSIHIKCVNLKSMCKL